MIVLNLGRRNVGKSTLALYIARRVDGPRVIFDPRGLFPTSRRLANADDVAGAFSDWYERKAQAPIDPVRDEIVVTPDGSVQELFDFTSAEAKQWTRQHPGPFAFVLDEVRFVTPLDSVDFDWLLRCADHASTRIIITGHRPVNVVPDIRAIADHWAVFQTNQESDLKILRERCSDRAADLAERLKPREFVFWDDGAGESATNPAHYQDPKVWYVPMLTATTTQAPTDTALPAPAMIASSSLF